MSATAGGDGADGDEYAGDEDLVASFYEEK